MKLGLFSDLHIHPFSAFAKIGPEGINSRLEDIGRVAMKIVNDAAKAGCKALLFGGDWFHEKRILSEQLDLSGRILSLADGLGLTVGMVPGNHDMVAEGDFSPIHSVRGFGRSIRLLDEGAIEFGASGLRIAGLPYFRKREDLLAKLKILRRHDILVLHAPCVGAEMASELVSMENDEAIGAEQLLQVSKAKFIMCGHYHKPQYYHPKKGWSAEILKSKTVLEAKILIPGAPCQHGFSDCDQTRGWWLLDTETMALKFNPITSEAPEFAQVHYKDFLKDPASVLGRYVNFTIPERLKKSARQEIMTVVREATAGVRFILEPEPTRHELRTDLSPASPPASAMTTYAEANPPPDKKRTMQLGMRAIDAAMGEK